MRVLITEQLSKNKYKTPEGYLICVDSVLARTGKQEYTRDELWHDSSDEIVEVDRKPEEVFSENTLASFENKPITVEHPDVDVNSQNYKDYAVGFVRDVHQGKGPNGEDVILGTLVITDAQTIEEIENGEHTDLSCGYDCDINDEKNPQQTNIRGNHVALCQQGRAGIARIMDSKMKDDLSDKLKNTDYYIVRNNGETVFIQRKDNREIEKEDLIFLKRLFPNTNVEPDVMWKYITISKGRLYTHNHNRSSNYDSGIRDADEWTIKNTGLNYEVRNGEKLVKKFPTKKQAIEWISDRFPGDKITVNSKVRDMAYFDISEDDWDEITNNGDDEHWIINHYDIGIRREGGRVKVAATGSINDLKKFYNDYHLRDYNVRIMDSNLICDGVIQDLKFNELDEAERELKEAMGLYKKIEGSHQKNPSSNRPYTSRQNQYNNSQSAELNEAINETVRNIKNGITNENAWRRLSLKLEGWESDPIYSNIAKRARSAINKIIKYLDKIKDSKGAIMNKMKDRKALNGNLKDFKIEELINNVIRRKTGLYTEREDSEGNIYTIAIDVSFTTDDNGSKTGLDIIKETPDGKQDRILLKNTNSWQEIINYYNNWRRTVRDSKQLDSKKAIKLINTYKKLTKDGREAATYDYKKILREALRRFNAKFKDLESDELFEKIKSYIKQSYNEKAWYEVYNYLVNYINRHGSYGDSKLKDVYNIERGSVFKEMTPYKSDEATYIRVLKVDGNIVTYQEIRKDINSGQQKVRYTVDKNIDYFKRMLSKIGYKQVNSLYDSKVKRR